MADVPNVQGPSKPSITATGPIQRNSLDPKLSSGSTLSTDTTRLGYIEPLKRKLGPHQTAVNEPLPSLNVGDPVRFQLRKFVGLLIASGKHKPGFSLEFLEEVSDLTTQFMRFFVDSLHKLTEVQRHQKPGIADLEMCLRAQNVSTTDLYREYLRTKALDSKVISHARNISKDLDLLLREYTSDSYTLEKDDPSLVFHASEQHEIAALVPRQVRKRDYIPSYFPDLPPDFTFTSTGSYMKRITDLKEIKLKLAEESRLNEASLYTLIDDDERRWRLSLEKEIVELDSSDNESFVSEIMSKSGDNEDKDVESPVTVPDEKFVGETDEARAEQWKKKDMKDVLPRKEDSKVYPPSKEETRVYPPIKEDYKVYPSSKEDSRAYPPNKEESIVYPPSKEESKVYPPSKEESRVYPPRKEDVRGFPPKNENNNYFDFVAYAQKRRRARDRYLKEMDRRRKARNTNVFMKAEQVYSPYAKHPPTSSDVDFFKKFLDSSFKRVIKCTRAAEQRKKQKLERLMEENQKLAEETGTSNGDIEFGFAFNPGTNLSDDSDDEEHVDTLMEFDFGDTNEKIDDSTSLRNQAEAEKSSMTETESPQPGQISGKAPLKQPGHSECKTSMNSEMSDDNESDIDGDIDHFQNEMFSSAHIESRLHTSNGAEIDSVDLKVDQKDPNAQVSWGDFGSEDSDDDELEDVE